MTPRTFRAFWAIKRNNATLIAQLPRGGINYEDIFYVYFGTDVGVPGHDGDYIPFSTNNQTWPNFQLDVNGRPMNGPIGVDTYYGSTGGATDFCAGPLRDHILDTLSQRMTAEGYNSSYAGHVLLDIEDWTAYWRRDYRRDPTATVPAHNTSGTWEAHWRKYITEQRPEVISPHTAYSDAAEQLYINSYMEIARLYQDAIFEAARELLPNAQFGEYGWPQRWYYEFAPGDARGAFVRESNSLYIPRMSKNWNYIGTSLYPPIRAVPNDADPDPAFEARANVWVATFSRTCREFVRVQAECGGKPVLLHVAPFFEVDGADPHFNEPLNDLSARLPLFLGRDFAFSGVIMWGFIPNDSTASTRFDIHVTGLNLMQYHIKNFVETMAGGVLFSGNSAIGIGLLG